MTGKVTLAVTHRRIRQRRDSRGVTLVTEVTLFARDGEGQWLHRWKHHFEEFFQALKSGKEMAHWAVTAACRCNSILPGFHDR